MFNVHIYWVKFSFSWPLTGASSMLFIQYTIAEMANFEYSSDSVKVLVKRFKFAMVNKLQSQGSKKCMVCTYAKRCLLMQFSIWYSSFYVLFHIMQREGERKKREYRCHFFAILTFSEVGFFSSKRMTDAAEDVGGERCTISLHQQPTTHKDSTIPSKSYNQKLGLPIYPCSLVSFVLSLARTDKKTIFWTFWAADSSPTIGLRVRNPK